MNSSLCDQGLAKLDHSVSTVNQSPFLVLSRIGLLLNVVPLETITKIQHFQLIRALLNISNPYNMRINTVFSTVNRTSNGPYFVCKCCTMSPDRPCDKSRRLTSHLSPVASILTGEWHWKMTHNYWLHLITCIWTLQSVKKYNFPSQVRNTKSLRYKSMFARIC